MLLALFYFLTAIQIGLGILSLRGGFRFRAYIETERRRPKLYYQPFVSIIAPCKGLECELKDNLAALWKVDYPAYEILFVLEDRYDPAANIIKKLIGGGHPDTVAARIIIAGPATDSGQKIHNLIAAIEQIDKRSEALVFVDSDARVPSNWLRALVEPLLDETVGAATGYRWFIPVGKGPAPRLCSVWNASIASALGGDRKKNFCWGGSTAVLLSTFKKARVLEFWKGAASDDFAMMNAMRAAGLEVQFVPECLIASFQDCTLRELIRFTNRQMKITRVYAPQLWKAVLFGTLLFAPLFWGLALISIFRFTSGTSFVVPVVLFGVIFLLGAAKSIIRFRTIKTLPFGSAITSRFAMLEHVFLWPIASLLYLINALAALFSRRILWRGILYELKSPAETVIIKRSSTN